MRRLLNSAFRRSAFLFSFVGLSTGNASPDFAALNPGYGPVIVTAPTPPRAPSDEDHARLSFVCFVVGMARARRRSAGTLSFGLPFQGEEKLRALATGRLYKHRRRGKGCGKTMKDRHP